MSNERLSSRLSQGEFALGAVVHMNDPTIMELVGLAGFDWASMTLEHAAPTVTDLEGLQRAADLRGLTTLLHVPTVDDPRLLATLHTGIGGIVLQQVQSREDVEALVGATRYPPLGHRGAHSGMRADKYGSETYDDFMGTVNDNLIVGVAIEDTIGVDNVEEILDVPGVTILFVGMHDLSHSVGAPNDLNDPKVLAALAKCVEAAKARDIPVGLPGYAHSVAELTELGAQLAVSPGNEYGFILKAFKEHVDKARSEAAAAK